MHDTVRHKNLPSHCLGFEGLGQNFIHLISLPSVRIPVVMPFSVLFGAVSIKGDDLLCSRAFMEIKITEKKTNKGLDAQYPTIGE